jgi:hypothetical protein
MMATVKFEIIIRRGVNKERERRANVRNCLGR